MISRSRLFAAVTGLAALCGCSGTSTSEVPITTATVVRRVVVPESIDNGIVDADWVSDEAIAIVADRAKPVYVLGWDGRVMMESPVGQGPCEVGGASSVAAFTDRSFLAVDGANRRVQRWSLDSGCVAERSFAELRLGQAWSVGDRVRLRAQTVAQDGLTLLVLDRHLQDVEPRRVVPFTVDRMSSGCPYCRAAMDSAGRLYMLTVVDSLYRVLVYGADGSRQPSFERTGLPPIRYTADEQDSVHRFWEGLVQFQRDPRLREAVRAAVAQAPAPVRKPVFRFGPVADDSSRLFASRFAHQGDSIPVDIFNTATGKLQSMLFLPPACRLHRVRAGRGLLVCGLADGATEVREVRFAPRAYR